MYSESLRRKQADEEARMEEQLRQMEFQQNIQGQQPQQQQQGGGGPNPAMASKFLKMGGGGASGGAASGGAASGGGGFGSAMASAGPWAALAAAIIGNESAAKDAGRRRSGGDHAKDLFSGKVLSQDMDYYGDKIGGVGGDVVRGLGKLGSPFSFKDFF